MREPQWANKSLIPAMPSPVYRTKDHGKAIGRLETAL
jgi:hypothetical protein